MTAIEQASRGCEISHVTRIAAEVVDCLALLCCRTKGTLFNVIILANLFRIGGIIIPFIIIFY